MGIYSRYATAFLALFLSSAAFSAVRVPVIQNDAYIAEVLSRQSAITGAISTPAGQVAYFGADKVYSFSPGDSVQPTIREIKSTVGTPSYPYGPGAAYPSDPNLTPSAATKLKVKPQLVVPKSKILSTLKEGLKTKPGPLVLQVAIAAAVSAVGWVMSDDNTQLQRKVSDGESVPVTTYGWNLPDWCGATLFQSYAAAQACMVSKKQAQVGSYYVITPGRIEVLSASLVRVYIDSKVSHSGVFTKDSGSALALLQGSCVAPAQVVNGLCVTGAPTYAPLTPSDFGALDPWVSTQTAPFLAGLIKEVCTGSLSPVRCFAEMVDRSNGKLTGPAFLPGPITSKTTSTTNPDGSTSTTTETKKTDFKINYGKDFFDVDTENKTTTTKDGELISESVEKDDTPVDDSPDTQPEPEPEPEYTFADSSLPDVEPFYTQKYPDGFQGVWDSANTDFEQSAFVSFLNSFVPSFSGSCPAFSMSFAIGGIANFGTHGFGNLCYALDFVKVCIMLGALFLCRAIVFGG